MVLTVKQVKEAIGHSADQVSRLKNGNIMVRKGYFYRSGMDSDKFSKFISRLAQEAGYAVSVVNSGDHWAAFKGGVSVAKSSHFYVELGI